VVEEGVSEVTCVAVAAVADDEGAAVDVQGDDSVGGCWVRWRRGCGCPGGADWFWGDFVVG